MHFGLAEAFQSGDRKEMLKNLNATLEKNTNHVGALLMLARHLIAGEEYTDADGLLERAFAVNAWQPEAWAFRAVMAHLRSDADGEKLARETALKFWQTNPEVDYLIGQNLSQKYRFAEGAAYQRRALKFDAKFLPAKQQLAQDLLRLGQDDEGWKLVEEVQKADPYDVVAFNLTTLRDRIAKFQTLTSEHFLVRMDPHEAAIYGEDALALLERAHSTLTKKYGLELRQRTRKCSLVSVWNFARRSRSVVRLKATTSYGSAF